jgi:hypothetical protein
MRQEREAIWQLRMSKGLSFVVWIFEMLCEAVTTTIWMAILALIQFGPDRGHYPYPYGYAGALFGISAMVFIEFALTGYLLTTLLAAQFLPRARWFSYPLVSLCLYLMHSTLFFTLLGNRVLDRHDLAIQVGGGGMAFLLTAVGDRYRKRSPQHYG